MEQLGVYVRYIDVEKGKILENFLEMKRVTGHPTANNIFTCLMEVLNPDNADAKMPIYSLLE